MPTTDVTRGEVLAELARIQEELSGRRSRLFALKVFTWPTLPRLEALIKRVEGKCEGSPGEWFDLTPFQAEVMNAMSHLSNAQEIGGYPSHEHEQINEAKRRIMPLLDKQETESGKG